MTSFSKLGTGILASYALGLGAAQAQDAEPSAFALSVAYKADVASVLSGGPDGGVFLDNLDVQFDADLSRAMRWSGATAHVHLLNNSGAAPNDRAGTLQGIDNIEVARQRGRVFEVWLQQNFANDRASLRVGLYDLNSEFYANDSAGLLLAPAFGIGSELAATGPNGPSIFPSTALAVRGEWRPREDLTLRAAVLNARAGVIGDPGSVDLHFHDGVLFIGEAAWDGPVALAVGGWRYSERQDDIRDIDGAGDPVARQAQGAYLTAERRLFGADTDARRATAFTRVGVSDGDTTSFAGGWQAGILVEGVTPGRPDSAFSFGAYQGVLSDKHRANERDLGVDADRAETSFEVTYSDRLCKWLSVQPDLQYFPNPGADGARDAVWAGLVRFTVELN